MVFKSKKNPGLNRGFLFILNVVKHYGDGAWTHWNPLNQMMSGSPTGG
jgi:hypothetical protein